MRGLLSSRHCSVRSPTRDPTPIFLLHSAGDPRNSAQSAAACQRCADRDQPHARDFEWPLPSAPDVARRNPSVRIFEGHWAGSAGQFPVQPVHRRNRGTLDKDFAHVQGALRPHPDGDEMPLVPPHWLTPGVREYGRDQRDKEGHESRRVDNTLGQTLDHARQPGPADRPPLANSLPRCC